MLKDTDEAIRKQVTPAGFFYGYTIVTSVFFILMTAFVAVDIYGVFFEPLIKEFNWSRTIISGASALNQLAFGIFCVISARICEKFNPRVVVSIYGVILCMSYLLMSQINSIWQLYLYYGLLVSFSTSIYVANLSIVARWFDKRRGLMTGVAFSGLALAAVAGPSLANWLISAYDWRWALIVLGIGSLVIMVLAAQFLRRDPRQMGQLPDGTSVVGQQPPVITGLSLQEALRTRQLWLMGGMYFIFLFCLLIVLVHIVIHAIGLGISATNATNILVVYGLVSIASVNLMGLCGDKFGRRLMFVISFLLMAISFVWLLAANEVWELYLFAAIFGLAYGGVQVLFSPLVAELFGLKSHGVILGAASFGGSIGATLGPLFAGYMFDVTGSYSLTFIVCIVLSVVAVVLTLLLKARARKWDNSGG